MACKRAGLDKAQVANGNTEELAALLVSVPDRAAPSCLKALQPAAFARQVSVLSVLVFTARSVLSWQLLQKPQLSRQEAYCT